MIPVAAISVLHPCAFLKKNYNFSNYNHLFLVQVTKSLFDMGCYEVSLGDTIGVGAPG